MTPEQRALMPQHKHPMDDTIAAALRTTEREILLLRASRVLRACREFPQGHDGHHRVASMVREWECEYGPAPASAERILGGGL